MLPFVVYLLNFLHVLPGVQEEGCVSGVELRKVRLGDKKHVNEEAASF